MTGRSVDPRLERLAVALAFVGGYVDAVGFVALAHVFTGHITGNTVMLAIDVAEATWTGILQRLLAIVMFIAGMVLGAVLNERIVRRGARSRFAPAFAVEAVLLTPLILSAGSFAPGATPMPRSGWMVFALLALAATALGLQNGTLRKVGEATVHTTYISGMVTVLTEGVLARWFEHRDPPSGPSSTPAVSEARRAGVAGHAKLAMLAGIAASFMAGALIGVALNKWRGLESLLVPFVLLLTLAAVDARRPFAKAG